MVDATTSYLASHARHDPLRVAEAADRGVRPSVLLSLELCGRCAALYTDLLALTAALPLAAVPMRRRDFTLSPADARRLRYGGWRAWWSRIGSTRDLFTRPLAIGFTTLGLAGLLLTTAPLLAPMAGAGVGPVPTAAIERYTVAAPQAGEGTPGPNGVDTSVQPEAPAAPVAPESSSTLSLSLGLLVAGGGLFAIRRIVAHRRRVR